MAQLFFLFLCMIGPTRAVSATHTANTVTDVMLKKANQLRDARAQSTIKIKHFHQMFSRQPLHLTFPFYFFITEEQDGNNIKFYQDFCYTLFSTNGPVMRPFDEAPNWRHRIHLIPQVHAILSKYFSKFLPPDHHQQFIDFGDIWPTDPTAQENLKSALRQFLNAESTSHNRIFLCLAWIAFEKLNGSVLLEKANNLPSDLKTHAATALRSARLATINTIIQHAIEARRILGEKELRAPALAYALKQIHESLGVMKKNMHSVQTTATPNHNREVLHLLIQDWKRQPIIPLLSKCLSLYIPSINPSAFVATLQRLDSQGLLDKNMRSAGFSIKHICTLPDVMALFEHCFSELLPADQFAHTHFGHAAINIKTPEDLEKVIKKLSLFLSDPSHSRNFFTQYCALLAFWYGDGEGMIREMAQHNHHPEEAVDQACTEAAVLLKLNNLEAIIASMRNAFINSEPGSPINILEFCATTAQIARQVADIQTCLTEVWQCFQPLLSPYQHASGARVRAKRRRDMDTNDDALRETAAKRHKPDTQPLLSSIEKLAQSSLSPTLMLQLSFKNLGIPANWTHITDMWTNMHMHNMYYTVLTSGARSDLVKIDVIRDILWHYFSHRLPEGFPRHDTPIPHMHEMQKNSTNLQIIQTCRSFFQPSWGYTQHPADNFLFQIWARLAFLSDKKGLDIITKIGQHILHKTPPDILLPASLRAIFYRSLDFLRTLNLLLSQFQQLRFRSFDHKFHFEVAETLEQAQLLAQALYKDQRTLESTMTAFLTHPDFMSPPPRTGGLALKELLPPESKTLLEKFMEESDSYTQDTPPPSTSYTDQQLHRMLLAFGSIVTEHAVDQRTHHRISVYEGIARIIHVFHTTKTPAELLEMSLCYIGPKISVKNTQELLNQPLWSNFKALSSSSAMFEAWQINFLAEHAPDFVTKALEQLNQPQVDLEALKHFFEQTSWGDNLLTAHLCQYFAFIFFWQNGGQAIIERATQKLNIPPHHFNTIALAMQDILDNIADSYRYINTINLILENAHKERPTIVSYHFELLRIVQHMLDRMHTLQKLVRRCFQEESQAGKAPSSRKHARPAPYSTTRPSTSPTRH